MAGGQRLGFFGSPRVRGFLGRLVPRALLVRTLDPGAGRSVLLTFDDGPHPDITPAVLNRLDEHGARAIFFVIGRRVRRAPHLLEEIRRRGHVLGNHSHLHPASSVLPMHAPPPFFRYYHDARRCQAVVEANTGFAPTLFRQPGGRLTLTTLIVPCLLGLRSVKWSKDVQDWRFRSSHEGRAGAEELLRTITPGDVVLLHDDNPIILDVLDTLLPGLNALQYDLRRGPDLL